MTTTHSETSARWNGPAPVAGVGTSGAVRMGRRAGLALFGGAALVACDASGMAPSADKPAPFPTLPATTKVATIELEKGGIISFSLFGNDAPQTVKNFEAKVAQGFYNGLKFHRVEDWVVQGGDPSGNGTGGGQMPSEYNKFEFKVGAVGIARGQDPRINNDSQFFIVKRDSPHLNGQYTNFGQVTEGLDLVVKIAIGDKIKKITVK